MVRPTASLHPASSDPDDVDVDRRPELTTPPSASRAAVEAPGRADRSTRCRTPCPASSCSTVRAGTCWTRRPRGSPSPRRPAGQSSAQNLPRLRGPAVRLELIVAPIPESSPRTSWNGSATRRLACEPRADGELADRRRRQGLPAGDGFLDELPRRRQLPATGERGLRGGIARCPVAASASGTPDPDGPDGAPRGHLPRAEVEPGRSARDDLTAAPAGGARHEFVRQPESGELTPRGCQRLESVSLATAADACREGGRRTLGSTRAHRPAHPLACERRDADAGGARARRGAGRAGRGRAHRPRHRRRRGTRPSGPPRRGASPWSAASRSAPATRAAGVHLLAYLPDPTYPPLVEQLRRDPRRPERAGACDPRAAARARASTSTTTTYDARPRRDRRDRPARTSPTPWSAAVRGR